MCNLYITILIRIHSIDVNFQIIGMIIANQYSFGPVSQGSAEYNAKLWNSNKIQ